MLEKKASNSKTVFVIEDSKVNMKLIRDVLKYYNYNVIEAYDGKIALELIQGCKNQIDLIIVDLQLPEIDGFELIKLFKDDDIIKNIPTIAMSAHTMCEYMEKAIEAGFDEYITKSSNLNDFIKVFKKYLD
jgi:CheY-like chemotaxis protein